MAKVRRKKMKGSDEALKQIKAQRGIERKLHFENGGTLVEWRGGPRLVQRNRARQIPRKTKNRGRIEL